VTDQSAEQTRVSPWWMLPPAVVFTANFIAANLASGDDQTNGVYKASYVAAAAVTALVIGGYALFGAWVSTRSLRPVLAIRPVEPGRAVRLAAAAFAVIVASSLALEPLLHGDEAQGVAPDRGPRDGSEWAMLAVAVAVLVALVPVCEELLFRGLGFAAFGSHAVGLTAGLFAIAHGTIRVLPVVAIAGLALGEVRRRSDSVLPGMATHAAVNLTALLIALATA
jgi:membrane protease YdiL (CAAX protease family)